VDLLYETARLNLPVPIGPMAQMGMSAPCTVAGTLAQENAEILAGVCITQLIRPGMPVCYGGICHAFDMRTTQLIFAGPEQALFGVAMTEMGKHYGLPIYINVGLTDAKRPDAQAEVEAVGPGGTFIDREHTVRHLRRELWFPRLLDRQFHDPWHTAGAVGTEERCRQRKEEILATHRPQPIADDLARALDAIVASARRHLLGG